MEFNRKVKKWGESKGLVIPPDVVSYLDLDYETEIVLQVREGKHGKYLAIWRKDQNAED